MDQGLLPSAIGPMATSARYDGSCRIFKPHMFVSLHRLLKIPYCQVTEAEQREKEEVLKKMCLFHYSNSVLKDDEI
jgi:hypothetical protein